MCRKNVVKSAILLAILIIVFTFPSFSPNMAKASGGSISMVNYYPDNGEIYGIVDHFMEQTTTENTNTTISVEIDGDSLISLAYQGVRIEKLSSDVISKEWHTWETLVPPISAPGKHTFQFISHYYVWQEADGYWAEFYSYSDVYYFFVADASILAQENGTISNKKNFTEDPIASEIDNNSINEISNSKSTQQTNFFEPTFVNTLEQNSTNLNNSIDKFSKQDGSNSFLNTNLNYVNCGIFLIVSFLMIGTIWKKRAVKNSVKLFFMLIFSV
jgi:hypothetical protein